MKSSATVPAEASFQLQRTNYHFPRLVSISILVFLLLSEAGVLVIVLGVVNKALSYELKTVLAGS